MECSRRRRGREHEGQVRSELSVGAKIVRGVGVGDGGIAVVIGIEMAEMRRRRRRRFGGDAISVREISPFMEMDEMNKVKLYTPDLTVRNIRKITFAVNANSTRA
ncbi:hypothetical protein AgCh_029520 [Apium graveolens]